MANLGIKFCPAAVLWSALAMVRFMCHYPTSGGKGMQSILKKPDWFDSQKYTTPNSFPCCDVTADPLVCWHAEIQHSPHFQTPLLSIFWKWKSKKKKKKKSANNPVPPAGHAIYHTTTREVLHRSRFSHSHKYLKSIFKPWFWMSQLCAL